MMLVPVIALLLLQAEARGARCRLPTENTTHPMRLDEAISMAQCHLGCVKKHMNVTLALEMATQESQQWPHLRTSDIFAYGSCSTLEKVMECRRGCFRRSQDVQLTRGVCRELCLSECQEECGSEEMCDYSSSICPLTCKKSLCGGGCVVATELPTALGSAPFTPQQPFTMMRAEISTRPLAGGLYTITITEDDSDLEQGENLNTFIAQVEVKGRSYFFPLTSLDGVLDIGQFSCDTVNVSFAAVNQYKISGFSPALELAVYGESVMPAQLPPNGIRYEWVEDTRQGYEGTAVVNITWEPQEGYEFISSYKIILFSQTEECGGQMKMLSFVGIGKEATYFVWRPMIYRMPVISCIYQAQIRAMPCVEPCDVPIQIIRVETDYMEKNYQPMMNLTCLKYVNSTSGIISVFVQWKVENTPRMLETIKNYQILTKLMDMRGDIPRLLKSDSGPKLRANGSQMAYLVHRIPPDTDENHKIVIRVTPGINEDYNWRQVPAYQECRVNIYPTEPSVPSANVNTFFVNETKLFLNITLVAPNTPYGDIESYEVVIVREPVPDEEDPLNLNLVRRSELKFDNRNQNGILNAENVKSAYRHIDEDTLCLFLHIRARNEYLWSDWSEAIVLERYPDLYTNCTVLQEPQNEISLYIYVVVTLCAVGLLVASVLAMFTANSLYKRHRIRKQMNKAFQSPGYDNPIFRRYDTKRRSSALWLPIDAPKADDWELPSANVLLSEEDLLGEGCFGMVHRGVVKGPIIHSRTMKNTICMNVAVKFLKKTATGSERGDFLTEIDTMKQIAEGNNPHVVNMIGCVTLQEPICLVTEFVKYGDLLTYLTTVRRLMTGQAEFSPAAADDVAADDVAADSSNKMEAELDTAKKLTPTGDDAGPTSPEPLCASYDRLNPYANLGDLEPVNLISFAYQIASGMEYLSSLGIVHRDLASRNILVGEGKQLKISDFGMARATVDEVYVKSTKGRLPWKWMAMESIISREFTSASDVWAYGVTLWEIGTLGGFPYPTTPNGDLLEYLRKGNRLECPTNCSGEIYDIMQKCWHEVPEKRPTFTALKTMFAEMLQENSPYIQLDNINTHKAYYKSLHTLEDGSINSTGQSGERLSEDDSAPFLSPSSSSSASTPPESSSFNLLKSNAGDVSTASLEEQQQPSLVPPNLYVATPTKVYENETVFPMEQPADCPVRPTQLHLNTKNNETEV